jgi:alpha-tubulin suppressor-like RCC1 family protein
VISFSAGWNHNLALTRNKTVYVWGSNRAGQLGLGDNEDRYVPTLLVPPNNLPVTFIAAGRDFSMIVLEDGSLWAFGESTDGQLGQGDNEKHETPQQVKIPPVEEVWCGRDHVFARDREGIIYSWGFNGGGQLGIGNFINHMYPTHNPNLTKFSEFFPGGYHNLGLDKDGGLWSWGKSINGRLGLGKVVSDQGTPKPIYFPSRVVAAACGLAHSIALTEVRKAGGSGRGGIQASGILGEQESSRVGEE